MLWAILCLLHYPKVQNKVQAEIDQVIGGDRKVSLDDKPNLPYTNAVLMESMRIGMICIAILNVRYQSQSEISCQGNETTIFQ